MSKSNGKLRFASLIRVSTEAQEKKGESLNTQRSSNESAVEFHGGKIVGLYGGQEHATPGYEKKEIDRLLSDAACGKFNAVIVNNADRWSRDNEKSQAGLSILKKNRIRFFVDTTEYDLFYPEHYMFVSMSAVLGQFFAGHQKLKSTKNRISSLKKGIPASGKGPWGRTFDRETGKWNVVPEAQKVMEEIAERYLAGEWLARLATEYGIAESTLYSRLMTRCGDTWEVTFNDDDLNIHEKITVKIPRLLDAKTIKAIRTKAEANKTFTHGQLKHKYLLARMVFCAKCGSALSGQAENDKTKSGYVRYYRHRRKKKPDEPRCNAGVGWVRADVLEHAVMLHLFDCFGNPVALERAVEAAFPNKKKITAVRKRMAEIKQLMENDRVAKAKIVGLVRRGSLSEDEAANDLAEINANSDRLEQEFLRLDESIENVPSPELVKEKIDQVVANFTPKKRKKYGSARKAAAINLANVDFRGMTWEDKRRLAQMVFSGKSSEGRRMGIYITRSFGDPDKRRRQWEFSIQGHLIDQIGATNSKLNEDSFGFSRGFDPPMQDRLTKSKAKVPVTNSSSPAATASR